MAGIYSRDQINYGGMLGNAMANRANYLQHKYDRVAQMGQNWGNAINQAGQTINNAFNQAAQYQYNQDQLANQQQFQAEQAALNRAQQLNMAREQQKFQEQQNALNRQNTYDIADLNRQNARDERTAQNVMNYQNQEAIIKQLQFEYDNTSAKTPEGIIKRAQLQSQIEQANNKLNYYAGLIPPVLGQQSQTGPTVISGPDAEEALSMFGTEAPKTAAQITEDNNTFNETLNGTWDDATKKKAVELAGEDPVKLQQIANKGMTVEERKAKSVAFKAEAQASYDKLPKGITGNVKPGSLARWKDEHPDYAKALGL